MPRIPVLVVLFTVASFPAAAEPEIIDLWPGKPPGETKELPPETDIARETDKPVGDRRIQKITNVSKPTLAVYRPDKSTDTGAAVIVCPGSSGLSSNSDPPVPPAAMATIIVSPMARETPSRSAAMMPDTAAGTTTRRLVVRLLAPSPYAASRR